MKLIGPGAGNHVDMASGFAAELGTVVGGLDLDLLNGIDGRRKNIGLVRSLFACYAIEEVLVVSRIVAVHAE